jgi:hypothetical protein
MEALRESQTVPTPTSVQQAAEMIGRLEHHLGVLIDLTGGDQ